MREQRRRQLLILFILLTGFFVGSALPELLHMGTGSYAGFFSLYSFQKYEIAEVAPWRIFPYVLSIRMQTLLFLWMSSFTAVGFLFHAAYIWWLAAAAGMLLALFTLRDGYEGLLFFSCCIFPQWIVYVAMWKREVQFLFRKSGLQTWDTSMDEHQENFPHPEEKYVDYLPRESRRLRFHHPRDLADLAAMMGLCLLGCFAESFLGTWTLKIFLQILT